MAVVRVFRARVDIGNDVSGLLFSFEPIDPSIAEPPATISQTERFYVTTPPGYDLVNIDGTTFVRDPLEGDNVYMRAARVVSRVWQRDSGFDIVPSTDYDELDRSHASAS